MLSKIVKATTMNQYYNIPCFNGIPQFLLLLQMTRVALSKNKREMKSEYVLSKIGKATTMNQFYNIPCFNRIPQFLLLLQMTGVALSKNKREMKSE